jgi:hypothetical protein
MNQDLKPHKRTPPWLVLVIGIASTCILMNLLTAALQSGVFHSWKHLNNLPSEAVQILNADYTNVWIKTGDGRVFTASLLFGGNETRPQWMLLDDGSKIQPFPPLKRGTNCEVLDDGIFPLNPKGKIIECAGAFFPGPEMSEEAYFALMSDGSVRYWHNSGSAIVTQLLFIISTFVLPLLVALGISFVTLIKHFSDRIRHKKT